MTVTVYSKPACPACNSTYKKLDKHGIAYSIIDIYEDAEALEAVKAMGYQQAPVVTADEAHWSGYRPDKIEELVKPVEESAA